MKRLIEEKLFSGTGITGFGGALKDATTFLDVGNDKLVFGIENEGIGYAAAVNISDHPIVKEFDAGILYDNFVKALEKNGLYDEEMQGAIRGIRHNAAQIAECGNRSNVKGMPGTLDGVDKELAEIGALRKKLFHNEMGLKSNYGKVVNLVQESVESGFRKTLDPIKERADYLIEALDKRAYRSHNKLRDMICKAFPGKVGEVCRKISAEMKRDDDKFMREETKYLKRFDEFVIHELSEGMRTAILKNTGNTFDEMMYLSSLRVISEHIDRTKDIRKEMQMNQGFMDGLYAGKFHQYEKSAEPVKERIEKVERELRAVRCNDLSAFSNTIDRQRNMGHSI